MIYTLVRERTRRTSRRAAIAPIAVVALGAALAACPSGGGLPPGFGQGTQWAIPILGALGDSTPLAVVTIDGKGPYLFAVDVNTPSAVDPRLARELGLPASEPGGQSAQGAQAAGAGAATPTVTIPRITLGNLTVAPARFEVRDVRATHHGRPVQGSIGREILHPTLLWTLDRDRQSLYLGVRERQAPPQGAQRVAVRSAGAALVVEAQVSEGATAMLRVSFEPGSAIRPELAEKAGLQAIGERGWMADEVRVGEASASEILFSAFGQVSPQPEPAQPSQPPPGMPEAAVAGGTSPAAPARPAAPAPPAAPADIAGVDGVLGQRFWASFLVAMYLKENAMWLAPRAEEAGALTAERLARWGALFDGCQTPACVSLAVAEPGPAEAAPADAAAGKPDDKPGKPDDKPGKPPKLDDKGGKNAGRGGRGRKPEEEPPASNRLVVTRDPSKKDEVYDVLLQAFDEVDAPLPAPYVLVSLPKGATEVAFELTAIAPAYERATSFRVVDATPFPPPCRDKQGCVWLQR
jgi:hypothetical protein